MENNIMEIRETNGNTTTVYINTEELQGSMVIEDADGKIVSKAQVLGVVIVEVPNGGSVMVDYGTSGSDRVYVPATTVEGIRKAVHTRFLGMRVGV